MLKLFLASLALVACTGAHAFKLYSEHAILVSDETGQILFEKGADAAVPIASLTKLMTAMVVLDSRPAMNEVLAIDESDVDELKHSKSHVPVGAKPRSTVTLAAGENAPSEPSEGIVSCPYAAEESSRTRTRPMPLLAATSEEPRGIISTSPFFCVDRARTARRFPRARCLAPAKSP